MCVWEGRGGGLCVWEGGGRITHITNIYYSPVAIQQLQLAYAARPQLVCAVGDARSMLQYADSSYEGVLVSCSLCVFGVREGRSGEGWPGGGGDHRGKGGEETQMPSPPEPFVWLTYAARPQLVCAVGDARSMLQYADGSFGGVLVSPFVPQIGVGGWACVWGGGE
jgi:hypothetical protein